MSIHDLAYRQLGEAEAIRLQGTVTGRHPSGYPLDGLLMLRTAADRYGHLIRNRERVTFAAWADRIEADPVAGIDPDRGEVAAALRAMHQAAQPAPTPTTLLDRIRRLGRRVSDSDTTTR